MIRVAGKWSGERQFGISGALDYIFGIYLVWMCSEAGEFASKAGEQELLPEEHKNREISHQSGRFDSSATVQSSIG